MGPFLLSTRTVAIKARSNVTDQDYLDFWHQNLGPLPTDSALTCRLCLSIEITWCIAADGWQKQDVWSPEQLSQLERRILPNIPASALTLFHWFTGEDNGGKKCTNLLLSPRRTRRRVAGKYWCKLSRFLNVKTFIKTSINTEWKLQKKTFNVDFPFNLWPSMLLMKSEKLR